MARAFLLAVRAGIAAIGLWALYAGALTQAPFSTEAQVLGPEGQPFFTDDLTPMMHRGEYRVEAARAFMRAALAASGPEKVGHLETAAEHLTVATDHRPNDARAWAMLAVVRADLGKVDDALASLRESWRAAPEAPPIADLRLALISRLRLFISDEDLRRAKNDLRILERWNGGGRFREIVKRDRYLRVLASQAE